MPKSRTRKKKQTPKFNTSALYAEHLFNSDQYLTKVNKPPSIGKILTCNVVKQNTFADYKDKLMKEYRELQTKKDQASFKRMMEIENKWDSIEENLGTIKNVQLRVIAREYNKSIKKYEVLLVKA
jgi:hypothetical protein